MSGGATIEIDDSHARVRFAAMPNKLRDALARKVMELRLKLEARVKAKLSGTVLHVRTGNLRRSVGSDQRQDSSGVEGRVFQSADVVYGRIHEFGGKTSPHLIVPVKAQVLAFVAGGKQVFAARVNHPGSVMPERSFMRSSLGEMAPEIVAELKATAIEAMQ